jgi:hypothetical protein
VEDPVELGPGNGESARLSARSEQQPVVAHRLAVVERQLAPLGVQPLREAPGAQLDVVLGVEALVVDVHLLASQLPAQVVLRQRRALVGALLLGADQQ